MPGKPLRNESIPGAKEMWAAVDKAAVKAPEWVKRIMESISIPSKGGAS